jgi:hypothetical protein
MRVASWEWQARSGGPDAVIAGLRAGARARGRAERIRPVAQRSADFWQI